MCDSAMLLEYGLVGAFDTVAMMVGEDIAVLTGFERSVGQETEEFEMIKIGTSFLEIQLYSQQLAAQMVHRFGVPRGSSVLLVCQDFVTAEIVSCLACLRIACPFVPIDKSWLSTSGRLVDIIANACPTLAIVVGKSDSDKKVKLLGSLGIHRISLLEEDGSLVMQEANCGDVRGDLPLTSWQQRQQLMVQAVEGSDGTEIDDEPIYILYTSGSTGKPKGVMGTEAGLLNRLAWSFKTFPWETSEVSCRRTPLTFVDSIAEIFGPLLAGISIWSAQRDVVAEGAGLAAVLSEARTFGVTRLTLLPSQLDKLLRMEVESLREWYTLRFVAVSGEACPKELARLFASVLPKVTLINLYGSTEVAGDVTFAVLWPIGNDSTHCGNDSAKSANASTVGHGSPNASIGFVIDGNELFICKAVDISSGETTTDESLTPQFYCVPDGQQGELLVSGIHVALGYKDNEKETRARFIDAATIFTQASTNHSELSGNDNRNGVGRRVAIRRRVFRSGDIVIRSLGSEEVTWLCRKDSQVKIRGVRVEVEEAQRRICRVLDDISTGKAFHTTSPSSRLDVEALVTASSSPRRSVAVIAHEVRAPSRSEKSAVEIKEKVEARMATETHLVMFIDEASLAHIFKLIHQRSIASKDEGGYNKEIDSSSWSASLYLREFLSAHLSREMVPTLILPLASAEAIPRTTAGKVDRPALAAFLDATLRDRAAEVEAGVIAASAGSDETTCDTDDLTVAKRRHGSDSDNEDVQRRRFKRPSTTEMPTAIIDSSNKTDSTVNLSFIEEELLSSLHLVLPHLSALNNNRSGSYYNKDILSRNFFSLGGSSTSSIEFLWRLQRRFVHGCIGGAELRSLSLAQLARALYTQQVLEASEAGLQRTSASHRVDEDTLLPLPSPLITTSQQQAEAGRKRGQREGNSSIVSVPVLISSATMSRRWATRHGHGTYAYSRPVPVESSAASTSVLFVKELDMGTVAQKRDRCSFSVKWQHRLVQCVDSSALFVAWERNVVCRRGNTASSSASSSRSDDVELLYVGSHGGDFVALDATTGDLVWGVMFIDYHVEGSAAFTSLSLCTASATCNSRSSSIRDFVYVVCYRGTDIHGRQPVSFIPSKFQVIRDAEESFQQECLGTLYALDALTGEVIWSRHTSGQIKGSPVVQAELSVVIVGDYDGMILIFDCADGRQLGCIEIGGNLYAAPVVVSIDKDQGYYAIIVASTSGVLTRLDFRRCDRAATVAVLWRYDVESPLFSTPLIVLNSRGKEEEKEAETVVFGAVDNSLRCVSLATGTLVWSAKHSTRPVFSSPCLLHAGHRGHVVYGAHDDCLRCVSVGAGDLLWERDVGAVLFSSPTCSMDYNARTGYAQDEEKEMKAAKRDMMIVACTTAGDVLAVCPDTGEVRASLRLPAEVYSSPIVVRTSEGTMLAFVGCRDDCIYAIELRA